MDIHINPVSGVTQQIAPPTPKISTDTTPIGTQTQAPVQPAAPVSANDNTTSTVADDSKYQAALRQAALSFKNVYAVSDTDFSIFKDATGKYITRYVSLRDGSVTYIPEPTLLKQIQMHGSSGRIAINA